MFGRKKDLMERKVFACEFVCLNCSFGWEQQFGRGIEIVQEGESVLVFSGKSKENIFCPNCVSKRNNVLKRTFTTEEVKKEEQILPQENLQVLAGLSRLT